VSGPTHDPQSRGIPAGRLRGSHPLRRPVPAGFGSTRIPARGGCRPLHCARPTPIRHRRQAVPPHGFGLLPVRSPLLGESSLFLEVLRCFSSPGAPPPPSRRQVPGRAPGGLPHSDTPGSQAASASPGHFAAWPRPSSAANAKASPVRPSRACPTKIRPGPSTKQFLDRRAPAGDESPHPRQRTPEQYRLVSCDHGLLSPTIRSTR
jgi:hypothetical protein